MAERADVTELSKEEFFGLLKVKYGCGDYTIEIGEPINVVLVRGEDLIPFPINGFNCDNLISGCIDPHNPGSCYTNWFDSLQLNTSDLEALRAGIMA